MTVCVASLFNWLYSADQFGTAIMVASDRMWTDPGLGIEYEGSRSKVASFGERHVAFVAGDLSFASMVIAAIQSNLGGGSPESTQSLATALAEGVAHFGFERAAKRLLYPLGVPPAAIAAGTGGMLQLGLPETVIEQIADRLINERPSVEFIVCGCDNRVANLFHVDSHGVVSSHADIGFLSIGDGGIHSSGYFMQLPYDWRVGFVHAMQSTFFAKKRAEITPGVGKMTDLYYITADGFVSVGAAELKILEAAYLQAERANKRTFARLTQKITREGQRALSASDTDHDHSAAVTVPVSRDRVEPDAGSNPA